MNTITIQDKCLKVNVSVYVFQDKGYPKKNMYIAYCPSLNITGYGLGKIAAKKEFEYLLNEYITEQLQNGTLTRDLIQLGWKQYQSAFDEPKTTDMITHDDLLSDVLNTPTYSKINIGTTYTAYA